MSSVSLPVGSSSDRTGDFALAGGGRARRKISSLKSYGNVIYALIMHDIKNRFFGSGLGQIVMVLWPFVHIIILLVINVYLRRAQPYGSSPLQYSAVSIFPFICFSYVTRWIVYSAITNRPFLQYPIIKPLDLLIARSVLEIVSIVCVGVLLTILVAVSGDDVMPVDHAQAVFAVCATIFLSVGFGIPNAVIAFVAPMWNIVIVLVIICTYISSGIIFVAAELPEQMRVPLSYNPLLQCTEWFRVAYYSDYPTTVLDRTYVLSFALVSLTLGLVMEKLIRRYI